jgi:predicted 3-demethylubiquinone-9 3-methyltransferase (glyoxalase superfamily)
LPRRHRLTLRSASRVYWNAIVGNGGQESACGWCKEMGIVLADYAVALTNAITDPDAAARPRGGAQMTGHAPQHCA